MLKILFRPSARFTRAYSGPSAPRFDVPLDKLSIKFARSSGPGGQSVNKRSSKVEIRFNLAACDWLPSDVKAEIVKLPSAQVNQDGEFIVSSQKFRTQFENQKDALSKLRSFIKDADAKSRGELTKEEKNYHKILRNRARADRRRRAKASEQLLARKPSEDAEVDEPDQSEAALATGHSASTRSSSSSNLK